MVFSTNAAEQLDMHTGKKKRASTATSDTSHLKWTKDLNVKVKMIHFIRKRRITTTIYKCKIFWHFPNILYKSGCITFILLCEAGEVILSMQRGKLKSRSEMTKETWEKERFWALRSVWTPSVLITLGASYNLSFFLDFQDRVFFG